MRTSSQCHLFPTTGAIGAVELTDADAGAPFSLEVKHVKLEGLRTPRIANGNEDVPAASHVVIGV